MDMKKYITVCVVPLLLLFSCNPENNNESEETFENPEYVVADLADKLDRFDKVVFKDDEHAIFTKYYENGMVSEYCIVSEHDTLGVFYSENGFPKYMTNGHQHIVFADFSEHSALIGFVQENGEYEILDIETSTNWVEYKQRLESSSSTLTKGKLADKEFELIQSTAVSEFASTGLEYATGQGGSTLSSILLWAFSAIAYSISDDAVWWTLVDSVNNVGGITMLYFQLMAAAGASTPVTLAVGGILAWAYDGYLIYQGIKNGDFRSPFVQKPEMFTKELEGGFWFKTASPAVIDWQARQVNAVIRLGVANFDLYYTEGTIEIGVKKGITLPEGWTADVVGQGRDYTLIVSVTPNTTDGIITASIPVYLAGVYNVQDDLVYEIQQTPQIQFDPNPVYFENLTPITVTVTSLSKEKWEVEAWPEWLDYDINRIATQTINSITLTPRYLDGASESSVAFAVTTSDGKSSYTKYLPVHPKSNDPFIYMDRVLCPDQNHPHAIDLGLSVKWACCDVGASTPLEKGGYYAWGETETKEPKSTIYGWESYIESDYKWYKTGEKTVNGVVYQLSGYFKYNTDPVIGYDGFTDGKTTLELDDDAAHVNWGGGWRMPTKDELNELMEKCSQNGSSSLEYGGGFITGPSGNTILMQNKGCYGPTRYYTWGWYHANYWTSTLDLNEDSWWRGCAWGVAEERRVCGQAVRPVCN